MDPLTPDELEIIVNEVERRGNPSLARMIREGRKRLLRGTGSRLHLVEGRAVDLIQGVTPDAAGEPWGTLDQGKWTPSLAAMVHVGAASPYRRVIVSDSAAQHFLYSKGIHRPGIVEKDRDLAPGDEVWVVDRAGIVLGRAKYVQAVPKNPEVLKPIDDLGWYLREGG